MQATENGLLVSVINRAGGGYVRSLDFGGNTNWTYGISDWPYSADYRIRSEVGQGPEGSVYFANANQLIALTPSGELLWTRNFPNGILRMRSGPNGSIYLIAGMEFKVANLPFEHSFEMAAKRKVPAA